MRSGLTISVPAEKKKEIEDRAAKADKTVSAYILYTVDLEQQLISEDELVSMSKQAAKDYRLGKTKVLKNLADLME